MITYTVWYKKIDKLRWSKIKNVKGDGFLENAPVRFFMLEDETRLEIPVLGTIFKFSNERFLLIKERMEQEAKQPLILTKE